MISVDRLVATPALGLRYLAGSRGGARLVTWAHACDLPDPWSWFDVGDLVMTTGGGLPADDDDQRRWLTALIDSGVSGVVMALGASAPAVTRGMLEVADERGFPVLAADYDLQFVALARTVIESAIEAERRRVDAIRRMYDVYWQSLHRRSTFAERLSVLERSTGWSLRVVDRSSGETIAAGRRAFESGAEDLTVEVTMPGPGDTVLAAGVDGSPAPDPADRILLEHIGGLVAMELEHAAAHRDRLRESGEALLAGLLDESVTLPAVWPELHLRGLSGELVVACWEAPDQRSLDDKSVHHHPCLRERTPLLTTRGSALIGIMPNDIDTLTWLATALAPNCAVGVSAVLALNSQVPESARQARLAVARAQERGESAAVYGDAAAGADLLPVSIDETRRLIRRTLGPLISHDVDNDGDLVRSVRTFLANDGGWQRTANALGIHRQTLVYRLKKVEQLTGLKPTSTHGATLLWLAFTGADRAGLSLDRMP